MREALALLVMTAMGLVDKFLNADFFGQFFVRQYCDDYCDASSVTFWGTVVGLAVGSFGYFLWNHSYAIIVLGMEVLFEGLITCFIKNSNVILIDVVF